MGNLVKRTTSVSEVGIVESDATVTGVYQFIQSTNSRTASNNIELSTGKFEQNNVEQNSEFNINDDNNPLVYGLKNLDRFAMVIGGKSEQGIFTFVNPTKLAQSNVNTFERATHSIAVDIVLQNLHMIEPVKAGLQHNLKYATEFNNLCASIARDAQRGIRVFTTYSDVVYTVGRNVIVEWSNNG